MTKTSSKFVLVVSDLHTGGSFGLFPPSFRSSTGAEVLLNPAQEYLWECWQHFVAQVPKRIDILLINGDAVEGQNLFEQARMLVEVDPTFQARAAAEVLRPLTARAKEVRLTRGSTYHVGRGGMTEEVLGGMLDTVTEAGRYAVPWWRFDVNGVRFDCAHRQSYMIRYRTTALTREIGFFLENQGRRAMQDRLVPREAVLVRSHTHVGLRVVRWQNIIAIGTPGWKIQDDFAQLSISPNRMMPECLGAVGIRIYDKPVDGKRVHIIPYLYDHPD